MLWDDDGFFGPFFTDNGEGDSDVVVVVSDESGVIGGQGDENAQLEEGELGSDLISNSGSILRSGDSVGSVAQTEKTRGCNCCCS